MNVGRSRTEQDSYLPSPFLTCCAILPTSFGDKEPIWGDCFLAEVSGIFFSCKLNARRSVHSPRYHLITLFLSWQALQKCLKQKKSTIYCICLSKQFFIVNFHLTMNMGSTRMEQDTYPIISFFPSFLPSPFLTYFAILPTLFGDNGPIWGDGWSNSLHRRSPSWSCRRFPQL